jgi:hypothetical protein
MIPNTTHWIQCANEPTACPVFPGDTRITMVQVPPLPPEKMIPKKELEKILEKEAPDFLASLLKLELPPSNDRLNIPILVTAEKLEAQNANKTELQTFIEEKCYNIPGHRISFSDFYEKFKETLPPNEVSKWSKKRVSMEIPSIFPKGKCTDDPNAYIGNITFDFAAEPGRPYYRDGIMIRNEKMKILALGHRAQTGKDTLSGFMATEIRLTNKKVNVQVAGFADELKDFCYKMYSWAGLKRKEHYETHPEDKKLVLRPSAKLCVNCGLMLGTTCGSMTVTFGCEVCSPGHKWTSSSSRTSAFRTSLRWLRNSAVTVSRSFGKLFRS